ncbi:MAG: aldose epimerase family protein [Rheinheimera sp.]|nr:aldose epimerase family protein [Rheinheimera sp.]
MQQFSLINQHGDELVVLAQGAILQRWSTTLAGARREVILGYQLPASYQFDPFYLGAVVGPYANRIGGGCFMLDQQLVQLEQNEGAQHLHGGSIGLHRLVWQLQEHSSDALVLVAEVPDGQGGYPGPITFRIRYQFSAPTAQQSELQVTLEASSSSATLIGPTLHPYFNLAGGAADVNAHQLQLAAAHYAVVDEHCIPTGELRKVQGSAFDFQQPRLLADTRLDHNFVVHGHLQQAAAVLTSPQRDLALCVSSDYPGLQVYTGDHLNSPFSPRQGICLEPQFFPDSPNQKGFPFHFTRPGQPFVAKMRYLVSKLSPNTI